MHESKENLQVKLSIGCREMRAVWFLIVVVFFALPLEVFAASKLVIVSYNVESDQDTDPKLVAKDIENIGPAHLWGLTEVESDRAVGQMMVGMREARRSGKFRYFKSRSGAYNKRGRRNDHIAIVYDSRVLRLLETQELLFVRVTPGLRGTLVGRFLHKRTKREFLFAVNHLKCCGNGREKRIAQIRLFREWSKNQKLPIIAVGDWNTPVTLTASGQRRERDFKAILAGGTYRWVKPSNPIKTQCSPDFNSMLDHVFLSGGAWDKWQPRSKILFTSDNYCLREKRGYADHRPVVAVFRIE